MTYLKLEKQILLKTVNDTLRYGLNHGKIMPIQLDAYPENLKKWGASFVTLEIYNKLRGCIGSLEAYQPLIIDIAHNAFAAAFKDPRFPPLTKTEYSKLTKHISILSMPQPLAFTSEEDLIKKLQPKYDGLILQEKSLHGTFLPAVWEKLPDPRQFLQQLKLKAGLPADYWSDTIKVFRYTTETIEP